MAAIVAALQSRGALLSLRRSLPKEGAGVIACRTPAALRRALEQRLIEAIVVAPTPSWLPEIAALGTRLPGVPVIAYAPFRPDDCELLLACREHGVVAVAVEGVDDSVVGEIVARRSVTAVRRRALADAPRLLRLTEDIQRRAWNLLLGEVERPIRTSVLARRLDVSREHLSRQFGAGGAPNLKRVIDLTRIACAAQMLANPGYSVPTVVSLLHFASPSHLSSTARRIAGVPTRGLGAFGPRGVLSAFTKGHTRSRLS